MNFKKDNFLAKLVQNKLDAEVKIDTLFKESNGYTSQRGKSILGLEYKGFSLFLLSDRSFEGESTFDSLIFDIEKHLRMFDGLLSGNSSKYSPYEFVVNSLLVKNMIFRADGNTKLSLSKKHQEPTKDRILNVIDNNKYKNGWDYDFKDMLLDSYVHFSEYFELA